MNDHVWMWKFFNPERKSYGLKNIRISVDGALFNPFHNILLQCCWAGIYAIFHIFLMF